MQNKMKFIVYESKRWHRFSRAPSLWWNVYLRTFRTQSGAQSGWTATCFCAQREPPETRQRVALADILIDGSNRIVLGVHSFPTRKREKWQKRQHCAVGATGGLALGSGVKYLSKNNLKYYWNSFFEYLYLTLLFIFLTTFTSLHSWRKLYFLLHTFSMTTKSTGYILNAWLAGQDNGSISITMPYNRGENSLEDRFKSISIHKRSVSDCSYHWLCC